MSSDNVMTIEKASKMLQDLLDMSVTKGIFANTESVIACQVSLNTLISSAKPLNHSSNDRQKETYREACKAEMVADYSEYSPGTH